MKITQTDIAKHLNITRLTVSKALNGERGVSEQTRERVINAAKELGYHHLEKKLAMAAKHQPAVNKQIALFLNLGLESDTYWAPVIRGMSAILSEFGYHLNLCFLTAANGDHFDFPMNFQVEETDGIIQFGNFSKGQMDQLIGTGLPLASIDKLFYEDVGLFCDTVMNTNRIPTAKLVKHLVDGGYQRIGYANDGSASQLTMHERWLGYLQGMAEVGFEVNPRYCFSGNFDDIVAEIENEKRLENLEDFPDAIVCCNDMQAISFLQYFWKQDIKVPEMIALTGHDNVSESEIADLTTINVNKEELGKCAAELILWRIKNPHRPYRMVRIYDYGLIIRGSTKSVT
ncbi:MAG: LacI family transcriptional regulator [Turicibacter sp.]|nr:LacI family transcriptional regulator [Turicibacter sp.]